MQAKSMSAAANDLLQAIHLRLRHRRTLTTLIGRTVSATGW